MIAESVDGSNEGREISHRERGSLSILKPVLHCGIGSVGREREDREGGRKGGRAYIFEMALLA